MNKYLLARSFHRLILLLATVALGAFAAGCGGDDNKGSKAPDLTESVVSYPNVAGRWTGENGAGVFTLNVTQENDAIMGSGMVNGKPPSMTGSFRMRGVRLNFMVTGEAVVGTEEYFGDVDGNRIDCCYDTASLTETGREQFGLPFNVTIK